MLVIYTLFTFIMVSMGIFSYRRLTGLVKKLNLVEVSGQGNQLMLQNILYIAQIAIYVPYILVTIAYSQDLKAFENTETYD